MQMRFKVIHVTEYSYSSEVRLDVHRLRLSPRPGPDQRILSHSMEITPEPAGMSASIDSEGNVCHTVWWNEPTLGLKIVSKCEVETLRENPYDFLLTPANRHVPLNLTSEEEALALCLHPIESHPSVVAFAQDLLAQVNNEALRFLQLLNQRIYDEWVQEVRSEGDPFCPSETFFRKKGACRDMAVLFMEACRIVGIPARFVSGYSEGDIDMEHRHLHAWPEVYLPGAGWRGFDPTIGLAVSDRHVAVAASHAPEGATPVMGVFYSKAASSSLECQLELLISA